MLVSPATYLPAYENLRCCGEGNSQNNAVVEGELCTADNISACSFYFYLFILFFFLGGGAFL